MNAKVKKWGNSFGIRLNKEIVKQLSLTENDVLEVEIINNKLVITPKESLNDILSQIDNNNIHKEIDFGRVGKELL